MMKSVVQYKLRQTIVRKPLRSVCKNILHVWSFENHHEVSSLLTDNFINNATPGGVEGGGGGVALMTLMKSSRYTMIPWNQTFRRRGS